MSNKENTVLYTGVTNSIERRMLEHKLSVIIGFTSRYRVTKLVYYEEYQSIKDAIIREKQIKGGSRMKKELLIQSMNPNWNDLACA